MTRRVLIDITAGIGESSYRGIGKYISHVLPHFLDRAEAAGMEVELLVQMLNEPDMDERIALLKARYPAVRIHFLRCLRKWKHPDPQTDPGADFHSKYLVAAINRIDPDIFVVTSPFAADMVLPAVSLLSESITLAGIVYDLIPLRFPDRYLAGSAGIRSHYNRGLSIVRRLDRIYTISRSAGDDLAAFLGIDRDRISVVYAGVDKQDRAFEANEVSAFRAKYALERPFVFYISGYDHRKNFHDAVRAFGQMPESARADHQLFLVSRHMPDHVKTELRRLARAHGMSEGDLVLGDYLDEDELTLAYQQAACLIFPSEYEGFGLPVIEALSAGTPVLCANNSSLSEIFRCEDAYFTTGNSGEAAGKLATILTGDGVGAAIVATGQEAIGKYSWQDTAGRIVDDMAGLAPAAPPVPHHENHARRVAILVTGDIESPAMTALVRDIAMAALAVGEVALFAGNVEAATSRHGDIPVYPAAELEDRGLFYQDIFYLLDETPDSAEALVTASLCPGHLVFAGWPANGTALSRHFRIAQAMEALGPHRAAQTLLPLDDETEVPLLAEPVMRRAVSVFADRDLLSRAGDTVAGEGMKALCAGDVISLGTDSENRRASFREALSRTGTRAHAAMQAVFAAARAQATARPEDVPVMTDMIASLHRQPGPRILFEMYHFWDQAKRGYITGIQRVVGKLFTNMAEQMPARAIWPTKCRHEDGQLMLQTGLVSEKQSWEVETIDSDILLRPGDTYFVADLVHALLDEKTWLQKADRLHAMGVDIQGILYDLLPVQYPEFFESHFHKMHARMLYSMLTTFNHVHCISRAVADELIDHAKTRKITPRKGLQVSWFHLGADIRKVDDDSDIDDAMAAFLDAGDAPVYLMVGTTEKRKNYALALNSFRERWRNGADDRLLVIGRKGWLNDEIYTAFQDEAARNERFVYMEHASDADLQYAYRHCTALVASSVSEGFGLPLIEASRGGARLIANDIPVFREVAGDGAAYYDGTQAGLVALLDTFGEQWRSNTLPVRKPLTASTWKDVAEKMIASLTREHSYAIFDGEEWRYGESVTAPDRGGTP